MSTETTTHKLRHKKYLFLDLEKKQLTLKVKYEGFFFFFAMLKVTS